ncbi:M24 family metallopeptidase [Sediminibacillus dalangtanensis]|uniref:M24 family metallopeptidase n=1 Tax=Sediminibacillus dalangtanensis TaxID=2729421 RepID=A0ABX7VR70_9BACI|nr:M24 family metallopeptidase [Sediminibacillus dalangtanensis]QTM99151.1 M24 family metallopeptidase [Sediminibacillus dalangtanensis]
MVENRKVHRLREMLTAGNKTGILLTLQKNISWLTNGRSFINTASEKSPASILVTKTKIALFVNNIEAERLIEEEFDLKFDYTEVFPWYEPKQFELLLSNYVDKQELLLDLQVEEQLLQVRTILTGEDREEVQIQGRLTGEAIEQVAFELKQGESEYQLAGRLAKCCLDRGLEPIVNLAAVDDRAFKRRHPLPTSNRLERYTMLVVCTRKKGKVVSASRLVHFGEPSDTIKERHRGVIAVDSRLIAATQQGVDFQTLYELMKTAYSDAGYPEEWKYHHQGGLSGYNTRERLLLPEHADHVVQTGQVFAWNPSITGVKSEDTILVGGNGSEIVSYTGNYPMLEVKAGNKVVERPDILIR